MEEALQFFRAYEVWIYALLGLGGLIYLRRFILSWRDLRQAGFGLEKESAQARLNQAVIVLVMLLFLATSVFVSVTFIAPSLPGSNPLPTPTLNLLATPTTTLSPESTPITGTPSTPNPSLTAIEAGEGCLTGQVEITAPANGQAVNGVVEVLGTADITNFGFYKIEMRRPNDRLWLTLQAGNSLVRGGKLGDWDTRRLPPGEYQLGLVVVDNQAKASLPCITQVMVTITPETAP